MFETTMICVAGGIVVGRSMEGDRNARRGHVAASITRAPLPKNRAKPF